MWPTLKKALVSLGKITAEQSHDLDVLKGDPRKLKDAALKLETFARGDSSGGEKALDQLIEVLSL